MTLQKSKNQRLISSAFENEFGLEILKSDKLRVTILIGVLSAALLLLLGLSLFSFEQFQRTFHGHFKTFLLIVFTVVGSTVGCLLMERMAINRKINRRGKASLLLQYLSAFIETSIPTVGMIIGAQFLGPLYALFTPAPLVYPLLIVLSALRLNFRLCIFTGAVAGLEYSALAMFYVNSSAHNY